MPAPTNKKFHSTGYINMAIMITAIRAILSPRNKVSPSFPQYRNLRVFSKNLIPPKISHLINMSMHLSTNQHSP